LHGLLVRSAIELGAPVSRSRRHDVEISWGERRQIPAAPPTGEVLSQANTPGPSWLTADGAGYVWRLGRDCEFVLDPERRHVRVHLAPHVEEGVAALFMGSLLAKLLAHDGHCVLHASAVETDAGTVGFVGYSGAGKTTLAALACVTGARLVTDDALRVELRSDGAWCYRGACELRLREQAAGLAAYFAPDARRSTLDERVAVRPPFADRAELPLVALISPRCRPDAETIRIERLQGAAAVLELMRFPRTTGWSDIEHSRRDLNVVADLAAVVPIYRADLPWGPEPPPELARELLAQVADDAKRTAQRRTAPVTSVAPLVATDSAERK
jgi:hypothetical protein